MATIRYTTALGAEYDQLFNECVLRPSLLKSINNIAAAIRANQARYEAVGMGIPWYFIGVIHNMEADLSFKGHLHNGDSLKARTVQVPAGRPKTGMPPFTWEVSAADALTMKGLDKLQDWSLARTLYELERYNGFGYRLYHQHVLTPYLWSYSTHYLSGKYVADGRWSDTAKSEQCGAGVLLRRMAELGWIEFPDQKLPDAEDATLVVPYSAKKPTVAADLEAAKKLQEWLNTHEGIFVATDGWAAKRTSDAWQRVTGHFLPGDPRSK